MLLAIDTATQLLSIALHDGERILAECTLQAGRQHSALLAPLVQQLLAQADIHASQLSALAVAAGPGSYTGLRIGVAFAKGMAQARDLPLVPLNTLEALAAQARRQTDLPLIATLPAGRSRAIWAEYERRQDSWQEARPPQISDWQSLLATCRQPCLISGEISSSGLEAIQAAQRHGGQIQLAPASERLRRAGALADIAWQRLRQSQDARPFPTERAMPVYLQSPG